MRLQLKNTPEQVELIRAMGSKDPAVAREASEAFAAFLGPVVQEVIYQAATASSIFVDAPYDEDDSPSYPLDLYYNEGAGYVTVWSQNMAGGLPTSHVEGLSEMKISTYRLDSAVSFKKRYARKARLDVVSKAVERMAQEVLVKQERNAWAVVLKGLAEASTDVDGTAFQHVVREHAKTIFTLGGLNDLVVRMKRVNDSFAGGTPADAYSRGLTDLYVSPEVKGDIRSFAYNAVGGETNNAGRTATDLPDSERAKIYAGGGTQEIFGINITELNELGVGQKYNTLFGTFAVAGGYAKHDNSSKATFTPAADQILVGVDNSKGAFVRPIARNADTGATFQAIPDEQFAINRMDKQGFYGSLEEGRVMLDSRAVGGIMLDAS